MLGYVFAFKEGERKEVEMMRKEHGQTLYLSEYTALPSRHPLSGFLVFCILYTQLFSNLQYLWSSLCSVQVWNHCFSAMMRNVVSVLDMIKGKSDYIQTAGYLYHSYIKVKSSYWDSTPSLHNSEVFNISLNPRAYCSHSC